MRKKNQVKVIDGAVYATTGDIARAIDVDPKTIVNWTQKGLKVAYRSPGKARFFKVDDVITYLRSVNMYVTPALRALAELPR